ncbi:unnamed protein product [Zymoseptoria tritici ST99CH_1A5]|uniref:Uncharacterized protein n=4 Tax=Zymoseptoria tritici TaxID=1047171 RepID=F9X4I1_ZYMTI|nr:uncharacterized protein MYCGRDRAFT_36365 [Zymoseptoria tritici IPO323]SMQ47744.1 unnamed protein product [Zymoseptoria tritici ST99CH_3D7]SMR46278.1 unnamed protein product [Zymoseptoria tritici ST99CH_1E4]SMR47527.1 unnamed protein product [Zymoseptoria tritici ST99CH_3D1]SMY21427.1 unnamed protein product [Zymoseptoria tritici ST99CH_1A5]EGP90473.1 hypothetical protein MYCGRDRAFT_36365 [Zymoseptoria tritici IPO323]
MGSPAGPYKLVTVNTAPERAQRLIGQLVEALKDEYTIIHAANCETIESVKSTVEQNQPDVLFCASMWTAEQAEEIQAIAKTTKPGLVTYAIPHGLKVNSGENAIVDHLKSTVPQLLKTHFPA